MTFTLEFPAALHSEPFSGRVYLFFSERASEPPTDLNWFRVEPFISYNVVDWRPETELRLTIATDGVQTYPRDLSDAMIRGKRVQAVARFNPLTPRVKTGPANGYSSPVMVPPSESPPQLVIDKLVPEKVLEETRWTKLFRVRSALLSDFHNRDVFLQAAVILPASYYDRPQQRYPTIWTVPGFGGTHLNARREDPVSEQNTQGVEFLRIVLDPSCPLGHHVFANSANNGPVGDALIQEFLPAFDKAFRSIADEEARFLSGHSSGGWSTLWLQMTYPDAFGGVWSTAPDPVDFRDFQRVDIYRAGENVYIDPHGMRRALAREHGETVLWFDDFDHMETVLGPGGQLHSFEAVFSPRSESGTPKRLWDRESGVIDPDVAKAWEAYDIRLQMERRWNELGPQLSGKLHIFMGAEDTFFLEGATRLLQQSLESLNSDAVVEIHERRDHRSLLTPDLRRRIRKEMVGRFLTNFPSWPDVSPAPVN